jgi:hypothetical protein
MFNRDQSKYNDDVISGEVAFFRIYVQYIHPEEEELILSYLDFLDKLKSDIKQEMVKSLGEAFYIKSITIGRGSIEVLIVIGTAYYAISRYKNFIESIELLSSQIRNVASRFFSANRPEPPDISVTWTPGPALARLDRSRDRWLPIQNNILLYYLILSHAALLSFLLSFLLWMFYWYFRI